VSGLRERKKQDTRAALRDAALHLTAARGLDAVTVEDIAEAADVSTRTFFNYFPSKEDAVIGLESAGMDLLIEALHARPADEEPLWTLQAVLRGLAEQISQNREVHLLRRQVVTDNPRLLPYQVSAFVEFERVLGTALQERNPGMDPALAVGCSVVALRLSVDRWIVDDGGSELLQLFDQAVERLAAGLLTPAPPRKRKDLR
jgi:AcrR family transcriptional regulator